LSIFKLIISSVQLSQKPLIAIHYALILSYIPFAISGFFFVLYPNV